MPRGARDLIVSSSTRSCAWDESVAIELEGEGDLLDDFLSEVSPIVETLIFDG